MMQEHKSRPWTNLSESHADRFGRVFRRGEIYWVGLGEKDLETHAQGGRRPCLIIQNDIGNHFSDTIIVLPLTGKEKPGIPTHVYIAPTDCLWNSHGAIFGTVLCEQICTMAKTRAEDLCAVLSPAAIRKVERAVSISLGLSF